jgi:hypothetical protein
MVERLVAMKAREEHQALEEAIKMAIITHGRRLYRIEVAAILGQLAGYAIAELEKNFPPQTDEALLDTVTENVLRGRDRARAAAALAHTKGSA